MAGEAESRQFNYELTQERLRVMSTPALLNWFHSAQVELVELEETSELRDKLLQSMALAEAEYSRRQSLRRID